MNTDLRERVARAIAETMKRFDHGPVVAEDSIFAADAVLAELAPELQPQAEPVVVPVSWADFWMSKGDFKTSHDFEAFEKAEKWRLANAAPQPQAEPTAELVLGYKPQTREELLMLARHARAHLAFINKLLDEAFAEDGPDLEIRNPNRPSESWHFKEAAPAPRVSADADDVALIDEALSAAGYAKNGIYGEAWQRIRASLGVVK